MKQNNIKNQNIAPYLKQFYKGNIGYLLLAFAWIVLSVIATLMISWIIQLIIDMITGKDIGFAFWQVAMLTFVSIALDGCADLFNYLSRPRFIAKALRQYQDFVYEQLLKKSISAFSAENSAVYISALSNDLVSIETGYLENIFIIVRMTLLFLGTLCLMFWYSPTLTVISIILAILPLANGMFTGNLVAKAEKEVSKKNEAYMSTLRDSLTGFSVIKSFRAEVQMCKMYAKQVMAVTKAKEHRRKMAVLVQSLSGLAGAILQFGIFFVGAWLALSQNELSAGAVLVFVQLLNFVIQPVTSIPQALTECKASKALIAKLDNALTANVRSEGKVTKKNLNEGIYVKNLSFGYEKEKPVLKDITYTFEAGKSYCLVGASGSGKSTLLHLLMASSSHFDGSITYDETDISDLAGESLYDMVSLIQQNVFVFNASIRDNITMFSNFPKAEVDRAIELSGLSALIAKKGEHYLCGENGSGLSGGEKQRISIARSLLKKSQVLLVDEATAALDAKTAYQVSSAILGFCDLTRIVITHSLDETLLYQYDCILAMKNGMIIEKGSFHELIEQKGYFYSLYTVSH